MHQAMPADRAFALKPRFNVGGRVKNRGRHYHKLEGGAI